MSNVKPIPDGFHTVTPYLIVKGAAEAIEFYRKAFGAKELYKQTCDKTNLVINASIQIGDSIVMLNDEMPEHGCKGPSPDQPSAVTLHIYTEDVDTLFDQAIEAGAEPEMPVMDAFWGDRYGKLKDPFGHSWSISTHKEDLTPDEIAERAKHAFA